MLVAAYPRTSARAGVLVADRCNDDSEKRSRRTHPSDFVGHVVPARDIPANCIVNLGIGQPTTVRTIDPDLVNAGQTPVTELAGASYFDHAQSFAMIRDGRIDVCVLGAYQVFDGR